LTSKLAGFGTTIFAEMSALATATGAVNLGQGFPDTDGPSVVLEAAVTAIRAGVNQYPPGPGALVLREAIARHQQRFYGLVHDPESEVLVTAGATEALAASLLGMLEDGDEVVVFEPMYDSYPATVAFAGATHRAVTLRPPDFRVTAEALRDAITDRTRVMLVNSPHNPTGRVLDAEELALIAAACREHDLVCVSDEVYEHLVYDGEHIPPATLPGMSERTLTISSVGKSFSFTGWKIGWASGPAELVAATRTAKQFLSFAGGTPLQHAAAAALRLPASALAELRDDLRRTRDQLCEGLAAAGLNPIVPAATYFVNADVGSDAVAFCRELPERAGVVAIPTSVFYDDKRAAPTLVRFAFCKRPEVIAQAAQRLAALGTAAPER
jgi:N-succinyldiaminopimelate aminotransferase